MANGRLRIGYGSTSVRSMLAEYGQYNVSGQDASLSYTTTPPVGEGVFYNPDFADFSAPNSMFDEHNTINTATVEFSTEQLRPGGSAKSVLISYRADEDEWHGDVFFSERGLPSGTPTLYIRKWMYFDALWATHWPVGLKTSRIFSDSNDADATYMSEKYVWQNYPGDDGPGGGGGDPDLVYAWGLNHACYNDDRIQKYTDSMVFRNGQPQVRTGHWYSFETFMQVNSADNVADGLLECRIDGVVVKNDTDVAFHASLRLNEEGHGPIRGTEWHSMWFGGNISTTSNNNFPTGQALKRFEDGYYLSTTADWLTF